MAAAQSSEVGDGCPASFRLNPRDWQHFQHIDSQLVDEIKLFYVFGDDGLSVLFVTNDDEVYSFSLSKRRDGELFGGIGQNVSPKHLSALSKKNIIKFAYGRSPHMLALSANGDVYGWGSNCSQQLGLSELRCYEEPTQLVSDKLEFVNDIACGDRNSLFLTSNRRAVYSCGESYPNLQQTFDDELVSMACNRVSSHIVTRNGCVFVFTFNSNTGRGSFIRRPTPQMGYNAVQVVSCSSRSLMLTADGLLYTLDQNVQPGVVIDIHSRVVSALQQNRGSTIYTSAPQIAHNMGKVREIAAVHYRDIFAAITHDGCVFVWGSGILKPTITSFKSLEAAFACYAQPSITFQPITVSDPPNSASVLHSLANAFDDVSTSNLKFRFDSDGGKVISVHRDILKIRCEHFRNMFQNQWKESSQDIIDIKDYTFTVYSAFLNYLYTDQVQDLSADELLCLLDLANCYCETELAKLCASLIKKKMTVSNVATVYATAIKFRNEDLKVFSVDFASKQQTSVFESQAYASLDKELVIQFSVEVSRKVSLQR